MHAVTDLPSTVCSVRENLGVGRLDNWAVIFIQGPDAKSFLQNRLSNDVNALQSGQGQLNAVLDRQGKIQGLFSLHGAQDGYFLILDRPQVENTVAQIEKYHIVEQFTVNPNAPLVVFACQGPAATELLLKECESESQLPLAEYDWREGHFFGVPVRLVKRSITGEEGYLFLVEAAHADMFEQTLHQAADSGVHLTPDCLEVLRLEAGLPTFGVDYTTETLLPETGLEREAVSYSKGCYLGQETIARIKTYGMVQQALIGLVFTERLTSPLPVGSKLTIDNGPVGQLCSNCFSPTLNTWIALAYLNKAHRIPGKKLSLQIEGQTYQATVQLLPFYDARLQNQSAETLLANGLKFFTEGYDEEAIKTLRQALTKNPELIEAYEALGVILSRHEQFDEAIMLMQQILDRDPDHVMAHTNLSVFYMRKGDKDKAEEEKAKATMAAFKRQAKASGLSLDLEAEQRQKEQAMQERVAMFQEALKSSPTDPLGNFGLGSALLELKRYTEAITPLQLTIEAQPKHSTAYLFLAKAYEGAEDLVNARSVYEKGIAVAAAKGDLMPLREMQSRLDKLPPV